MDTHEQKVSSWIERVEALINLLEGSTVSELELTEAGTEIIIRRQPPWYSQGAPLLYASAGQPGLQVAPGTTGHTVKEDSSVAIIAPLTGVFYASPSPTSPPFVTIGDEVQVGQVIALIEAMKVFNEIQAEVSGHVSAIVANHGEVVQKGDVILRVQPA
ncbi:MAG: acetyl-CoA carboxylase biotin carboxyl carrier protein [Ktedonobacteraceae bacterium]